MDSYSKIDQPEILALLFPTENNTSSPNSAAEDISFDVGSEGILNCRYYLTDPGAPILFYYPATNKPLDSLDMVAKTYRKHGLNVFLASYRGCGKNSGSPSIAAMYTDSEKLFPLSVEWLRSKNCAGPLFVMGQSLGSICAIDTVFKNGDSIKGMILESGICGTASFLKAMGADLEHVHIVEEEAFNNIAKIEKIKTPTLIFHGAKDALVAVAEAENLQAFSGARTKQFFVIPGAEHHTVGKTGGDLYVQTIKQFTDTVCGVNTWRQKRRSHKRI